ncbi:MAG: hypothetical protein D6690_09370 [Nitrospirae bacterium]|nr:MAG: hypothetical protein D6690_09370 [Nitrospirota bacterium]
MALNERIRQRFLHDMRRRILDLRTKADESWEFAIETMFQERLDTYLRIERGLAEVIRMLELLDEELEDIHELATAQRLESRLEFIEDQFEEYDSEIRQRPRRRRRRINLFAFFQASSRGGTARAAGQGEIHSMTEAYAALGLEYGSPLSAVTKAFRQKVKRIHPDIRNGDRSAEPELRRIIEAYQLLKNELYAR